MCMLERAMLYGHKAFAPALHTCVLLYPSVLLYFWLTWLFACWPCWFGGLLESLQAFRLAVLLSFWHAGFWHAGLLSCWLVWLLACWLSGLLTCWLAGLLAYCFFVVLSWRLTVLLSCWLAGWLSCWLAGWLSFFLARAYCHASCWTTGLLGLLACLFGVFLASSVAGLLAHWLAVLLLTQCSLFLSPLYSDTLFLFPFVICS